MASTRLSRLLPSRAASFPKRPRSMANKLAARRMFRVLGSEQLEHRVLLAAAATITWTGGSAASDNWSDPANWNLNRAPINGDSLVFPASAHQLTNHDDISGLSVNSITFQGTFAPAAGGYRIGGDDLTLGAGGIVDNATGGPAGTTTAALANEIDLNLNLNAAQSWSNSGTPGFPLTIDGNVANGGFTLTAGGYGTIVVAGQISGSGGLAVTATPAGSTPTVELKSANAYTGATDVSNGTLIVDGSTAASSAVAVGVGATLGGTGTIGGTISAIGGNLSPGAGPDPSINTGTLTSTGDVTIAGINPPPGEEYVSREAVFAVQLGGAAAAPTNDQLDSAGTISLSSATLDLTVLSGAEPFNPGQQFVIAQAGAPISGTFNGLAEGSTVSDGTQNFTISYANNRVTLTAQPLSFSANYLNGQAGDGTPATFVHNLYRELLGREPDAAGQAFWTNVFTQAASHGETAAAQQALVSAFLHSTEYREHLVEDVYTHFLNRQADAAGLAFWTAKLGAGTDEKSVLADIVGSNEYFNDAQGSGFHPLGVVIGTEAEAAAWVKALYGDLLGRTADSSGLAYWTQQTLSMDNPVGRATIASELLDSAEANHKLLNGNYPGPAGSVSAPGTPALGDYTLTDITGNGWDNLYFQGNLSADAVDTLFAQLQAGASYNETIAGMLEMSQYLGHIPGA